MENSTNISKEKEVLLEDFKDGLAHGIKVSNLAYLVAKEMDLNQDMCYDIAVAGLVHDIGKLQLSNYLYGRNKENLSVEEMQYMRMHSKISYDIIQHHDFSYLTLETVLYHHENYDGSGYPEHLKGEDIPIGARVLRVVDTFVALISVRPYRAAFDRDTAVEIMIDEIRNYDMEVFIAFQRVINTRDINEIINMNIFEKEEGNESLLKIFS